MKCSVENCNRDARAKGLCMPHYLRQRYFGGLNPEKPIGARAGKFSSTWKGGTFKTVDGRVMMIAKDHPYPNHVSGYVYRYRLVMEKHLGRYLLPTELVHHKNEVVDDDRLENLEVTNRADHINHHRAELTKARLAKGWNRKGRTERVAPRECMKREKTHENVP